MRVMFILDIPIYEDAEKNYFTLNFSIEYLKNMALKVFEEVTITTRYRDISVLTMNEKKKLIQINNDKVNCKPCYSYEYGKDLQAVININKVRKEITKIIEDVDCVIAMLPGVLPSVAYFEAKKLNKEFISFVGACPWDLFWNSGKITGKISAPFFWAFTKYIVKKSKWTWYVTDVFLQKRYPSKNNQLACSDVVRRDANENMLIGKHNKLAMLEKSDRIIIATAGTVQARHKGQKYVIEAISVLNKLGYNFQYELAGSGDCSYLKNIAEKFNVTDKVIFKGLLSEEELYKWYDEIDIYIQPSLVEGLPRSLIEAMSRGCACIASSVGGIPELLENEYLFKKKNVKSIVKIIENVVIDLPKCSNAAFEKSRKFRADLLNEKQLNFLAKIKNYIERAEK